MLECDKLSIVGDIGFGSGVTIQGDVTLTNESEDQRFIADGSVLSNGM